MTINLELISVMKSSMTIQDIAFISNQNMSKKGTTAYTSHVHVLCLLHFFLPSKSIACDCRIMLWLFPILGPPSLVVGESGGVKVYTVAQHTGTVCRIFAFF